MKLLLRIIFLVFLWAGLMTVACGGKNATSGGDGDADRYGELLYRLVVESYCESSWECSENNLFSAQASRSVFGRVASVDDCKNLDFEKVPRIGREYPRLEYSIEEGRIIIDSSRYDECKDALKDYLCSEDASYFFDLLGFCDGLLQGTVAAGETCILDEECEGALGCNQAAELAQCYGRCELIEPQESDPVCGREVCENDEFRAFDDTCEPRRDVGDECQFHGRCQQGLMCSSVDSRCIDFVLGAAGDDCVFSDSFCEPGTRCLPTDPDISVELAGVCAPIGDIGDECIWRDDCLSGLECHHNFTAPEPEFGECGEPQLRALGEGCFQDRDCESELCNRQIEECIEPGAVGDECSINRHCESGQCDRQAQLCIALSLNGERCDYDGHCESDHCNEDISECAPPLANGESCVQGFHCESGHCSFDRRCAPLQINGEECITPFDCESGFCLAETNTCTPNPRDTGGVCEMPDEG